MKFSSDRENSFLLKIFLSLFVIFNTPKVFAQSSQAFMLEPQFSVLFPSNSKWSYSFGLANRGILIDEIDADNYSENVTEHLELNSWVNRATGENSSLSLGIRYRFREIFNPENENMFRILQQYYIRQNNQFVSFWHRGRTEQRFGPSVTIFRLRYQLGLSKPISKNFSMELQTEALYSISSQFKPQPEQRLALGINNTSFEAWELNLSLEYRMDNYIRDQQNNLFLMTMATLQL